MQENLTTSRPIRVCLVSPKSYPLFNPSVKATFGGAEVDLYYLGTELARDPQFHVSFITADYGQADTEVRQGARIIKSLRFEANPLKGALKIWQAMKKADADVYMIKSISSGLYLVALFCRLHHRRLVYRTAHTTHCDGTYLKEHPLLGRLYIRFLKAADAVFAQNESDREGLTRTCGVDAVVVPNGHRLQPLSNAPREIILWVGRSVGFKHPDRFIQLARAIGDERFVMICQKATGDQAYDQLRQAAAQVQNLTFIEHVDFTEIDSWFERAKVFVNTSDSEGFPNTFIQACKAQTAILSFAVNPDGFLDRHQCGLSAAASEAKLQHTLKDMLTDQRFVELGQNGRRYVEQTHSVSRVAEVYKTCFKKLAGGTR